MTDRPTEEQERELTQPPGGARTSTGGELSEEKDQEQLQHEIEETRAELGDTVDALAQKADVKARVSEKVEQRKAALRPMRRASASRATAAGSRLRSGAQRSCKKTSTRSPPSASASMRGWWRRQS